MKTNRNTLHVLALVAACCFAVSACKKDEGTTGPSTQPPDHSLAQADLDAATVMVSVRDTGIVGDPYQAFGNDTVTTKHKIRDLFATISREDPLTRRAIFVRRAYKYNNNQRGQLINNVVLVKWESGFYSGGGDFEYMNIPYDSTTNYSLHPNGMLPAITDTLKRGATQSKFSTCVTCHLLQQAGNNRLFSR